MQQYIIIQMQINLCNWYFKIKKNKCIVFSLNQMQSSVINLINSYGMVCVQFAALWSVIRVKDVKWSGSAKHSCLFKSHLYPCWQQCRWSEQQTAYNSNDVLKLVFDIAFIKMKNIRLRTYWLKRATFVFAIRIPTAGFKTRAFRSVLTHNTACLLICCNRAKRFQSNISQQNQPKILARCTFSLITSISHGTAMCSVTTADSLKRW